MKITMMISSFLVACFLMGAQAQGEGKSPLPNKVETPKQQHEMDLAVERMNDKNSSYVTDLKFYCEHAPINIKFEYNLVALAERDNTGGYLNCGSAIWGMKALCQSDKKIYSPLFSKHIKAIDCKLLPDPKAFKLSLENGVLHVAFGEKYSDNKLTGDVADFLQNYKYPTK